MNYGLDAFDCPPMEAESDGFTYHVTKGLRFKNIAPAPVSELRLLFRKNAAKSRVQAANKSWVTAQLRLYDIPFKASDKNDALKSILEAAVNAQKCDKLPASTVSRGNVLRKMLEEQRQNYDRKRQQQNDFIFACLTSPSDEAKFDFDKFLAKYFLDDQGRSAPQKQPEALVLQSISYDHSRVASKVHAVHGLQIHGTNRPDLAVIGWPGLPFEKGLDDAFATLSDPSFGLHTPTSEANFDSNRFMAKYFLSGLRGRPEKHKTPMPVELYQFLTRSAEIAICDEANSIPGLAVARTAGNNHLIVGWQSGLAAFIQQAKAAADKEAEERKLQQDAQEKAEYEEKMSSHRLYAQKHRPHTGPLRMEHVVGSYTVECARLDEYHNGTSTLDIHPPKSAFGASAAFNFGLLEGTMLMASSKDSLEQLREEEEEAENDEHDARPCGLNILPRSKKRKATEQPGSSNPAIKRKLDETPHPNRVYFQWRGRETGESVIEVDYQNEHVGHIDFENGGLTAKGAFLYPGFFAHQKLEIKLYKTDDNPQSQVKHWSTFSEKQYEFERVNRWR